MKAPERLEVPAEILAACRELREGWDASPDTPARETRRVVPHPARPGMQVTVTLLRPHALRLATLSFLVRITEVEHYAADRDALRAQLLARLSPAEREIIEQLQRGETNKDIARRLGKSLPTVKNQIHSILVKTGVSSRSKLIALLT